MHLIGGTLHVWLIVWLMPSPLHIVPEQWQSQFPVGRQQLVGHLVLVVLETVETIEDAHHLIPVVILLVICPDNRCATAGPYPFLPLDHGFFKLLDTEARHTKQRSAHTMRVQIELPH